MEVFNKEKYSLAMANFYTLRLSEGFVKEIEAAVSPARVLEVISRILCKYNINGSVFNKKWDERYAKLEAISKGLNSKWGIFFHEAVSNKLDKGASLEEMVKFLAASVGHRFTTHEKCVMIVCYILTSRRLLSMSDKSTSGCVNTRSTSVSGG